MRHALLALVFVAAGCAHSSSSDEKPDAAAAAPSAAAVPPLPEKAIVVGSVLGADGKPLAAAHVHLGKTRYPVGADGAFRIETDPVGFTLLRFSGVSHGESEAALPLTPGEHRIDVRLATHPRAPAIEKVALIVEKDGKRSMRSGQPMQKRPDGTFALTVTAPAGRFAYQLLHVTQSGNTMNGTQAGERYEYDGGGDYVSVLDSVGGTVEVVFDPSKLPAPGAKEQLTVANDRDRRVQQLVAEKQQVDAELQAAAMEAMKTGADFQTTVEATISGRGWREKYAGQLEAEKDPSLREVLLVTLLGLHTDATAPAAQALANTAIAEIDARSGVWALDSSAAVMMVDAAADQTRAQSYAGSLIRSHPSPDVSAALLLSRLQAASKAGELEKATAAYDELQTRFPESQHAFMARRMNPSSPVRVGAPVPAFAFPGWKDAKKAITPESLKGKTYLIELWASWCKPCIAKLDTLHALKKKHGAKGFEIVGVAIMDKREAVKTFVETNAKKWPMPWLHAYVPEEDADRVMKSLSAFGLPSAILVGPDGKILATNTQVDAKGLDALVDEAMR